MNIEVFYDGRISGAVVGRDGQPASGSVSASYDGPEKLNAAPDIGRIENGHFDIPPAMAGSLPARFLS